MAKCKIWDGSQWVITGAKDAETAETAGDADTLDGNDSTDFAPASHVGATGAAHGIATTSVNGFMSDEDKTKLNGIEVGAEANDVNSVNGEVGNVSLSASDVGAASQTHSHGTFDRNTTALSGSSVFSDIDISNGIVTGLSTKSLTKTDLGLDKVDNIDISHGTAEPSGGIDGDIYLQYE